MSSTSVRRVLVTGANGNLGRKLTTALLASNQYDAVLGLDIDLSSESSKDTLREDPRLTRISADLTRRDDERWLNAVKNADAIVHLAAQNPRLTATWADAAASFDMTANLVAASTNIKRIVFASSNHVMGGYKETEIASSAGGLKTDLPPRVGTRSQIDGAEITSTAYATAKLMGERLLAANASFHTWTSASLRIGWCQPGENRPETISASGASDRSAGAQSPEANASLRWFRNMWLSNGDFSGFVQAALQASPTRWRAPSVVINAMSANTDMPWDLGPARDLLAFTPRDNLWSVVPRS